jgi:hypothetical protein
MKKDETPRVAVPSFLLSSSFILPSSSFDRRDP